MAEKFGSLVCPITFTLFIDPVIAEDGHTYEREAIINWIQRNGTSPLTRESITIAGLRRNHTVKCLVNEFKSSLSKHQCKFKLGIDIERSQNPFFQTTGKALFDAQWIGNSNGPPIALLKLFGARAEKEASFYEHLTRHLHIVYTYGLVESPYQHITNDCETYVMLLQEKAPYGNLQNLLQHRLEICSTDLFSDNVFNEIFLQITDAMIFLSEKDIIHGDLACRNVLVFRIDEKEPKQTLVKLTDFGISRGNTIYSKIDAVSTVIDTVPIRSSPPEVLQNSDTNTNHVYSEKSDMFAMGVLMWEAYSYGKVPWGNVTKESEVRRKVINGERLFRPSNCKSDCQWELILKCMAQQPNDRPTFLELKKQLTEFITPSSHLNKSKLCHSISMPQQLDDIPRSSTITEKSKQSSCDNICGPTSSELSMGRVCVKEIRAAFEKKSGAKDQIPSPYRSGERLQSKAASPKKTTIENIPPGEDLIKLTKWH